jgi:hypothetical protein
MLGQTNTTALVHEMILVLKFWVGGEIRLLLFLYLVSWLPPLRLPHILTATTEPVIGTDAKLDDGVFGAIS